MPEEIEEEYHTDSEEENLEVEQLFQGLLSYFCLDVNNKAFYLSP